MKYVHEILKFDFDENDVLKVFNFEKNNLSSQGSFYCLIIILECDRVSSFT